jgi:hypothetical protein
MLVQFARICRLAQGMPLGLVLAVGWLVLLTFRVCRRMAIVERVAVPAATKTEGRGIQRGPGARQDPGSNNGRQGTISRAGRGVLDIGWGNGPQPNVASLKTLNQIICSTQQQTKGCCLRQSLDDARHLLFAEGLQCLCTDIPLHAGRQQKLYGLF